MNRVVRLTVLFRRACGRLDLTPQSERGKAMARTIAALASAKSLPGPVDTPALFRTTTSAFVRRVANRNLWLWYRVDEATSEVTLVDPCPATCEGEREIEPFDLSLRAADHRRGARRAPNGYRASAKLSGSTDREW